jgi:methionyl-tRNA synthetase
VFACNAYIDSQAPWTLRKTDPARMETVLAMLYVVIAHLAIGIQPVIPMTSAALLDQMGIAYDKRDLGLIDSYWYAELADSGFALEDNWYDALRDSGFTLSPPKPLFPRLELPADAGASPA